MRLVLAVAVALVIVPAPAGFAVGGDRWPGPTISVWNATAYGAPVLDAERAWNNAGAAIRFVPAASPASADVVVRYGSLHEQGRASVGYAPGDSSLTLPRGLSRMVSTTLSAHELGHILGLGHESRGCTVMAAVVKVGPTSRCAIAACKALWRCLVQRDDDAGAIALYGRRVSGSG